MKRDDPTERCNMTELRYDAPLATFDGDEWSEFLDDDDDEADAVCGRDPDVQYADSLPTGGIERRPGDEQDSGGSSPRTRGDGFGDDTFSGSLEDLVSCFDENVRRCFRNYSEDTEFIAPVQIRTHEEVLHESQTWWTITGNFGSALPIDWSKSLTRRPLSHIHQCPHQSHVHECSRLSDDDDDSMVDSDVEFDAVLRSTSDATAADGGYTEDTVISAEQVISEIESMLEDGDVDAPATSDSRTALSAELLQFTDKYLDANDGPKHLDDQLLRTLSTNVLAELLADMERRIRLYSESLVEELALRDELDFAKEQRNQFIWLLLRVQKRRHQFAHRHHQQQQQQQQRDDSCQSNAGYLVTVIPYNPYLGSPSVENLQIYIKLLSAINEESSTLPALLTDYILNVLCPAAT